MKWLFFYKNVYYKQNNMEVSHLKSISVLLYYLTKKTRLGRRIEEE